MIEDEIATSKAWRTRGSPSEATASQTIESVAIWLGSNQKAMAGSHGTRKISGPSLNELPGSKSWYTSGCEDRSCSEFRNLSCSCSVAATKYGESKRDVSTRLILHAIGSTSMPMAFRFERIDSNAVVPAPTKGSRTTFLSYVDSCISSDDKSSPKLAAYAWMRGIGRGLSR